MVYYFSNGIFALSFLDSVFAADHGLYEHFGRKVLPRKEKRFWKSDTN
jgi:hypothetical protein